MNQNTRLIFGISLCLVGVPLGMYLSFFFPGVKWSHLLMILSVIFVGNWKNVLTLKFPIRSRLISLVIFFQLLMIIYGIFSGEKATFAKYSIFQYYIIVLSIAICSNSLSTKLEKLPYSVFCISLIGNICGAYLCSLGLVSGEEAFLMRQYDDNYVLDPITASVISAINVISGIFLVKDKITKILFYVGICMAVYVFLCTFKRTLILFCLFSFAIYMYKNAKFNKRMFIKIIRGLIIAVVLLFILSFFMDNIGEQINRIYEHFYKGVLTLLGEKTTYDVNNSAVARVVQRNRAFLDFSMNANSINYIIGMGYMRYYIDAPIIQSYLDMGILGFVSYFFIVVIFPIRCLFKMKTKKSYYLLTLALSFETMLEMFSAGNPYGYTQYTYIIMLGFAMELFKYNSKVNYGKENRMG